MVLVADYAMSLNLEVADDYCKQFEDAESCNGSCAWNFDKDFGLAKGCVDSDILVAHKTSIIGSRNW
jgi:hypothetical protein